MIDLPKYQHTVEDNHYNIKDIGVFPRVTTVLDACNWAGGALMGWQASLMINFIKNSIPGKSIDLYELNTILKSSRKCAQMTLEDAGRYGSAVHAWIEDYMVNHVDKPCDTKIETGVASFKKFYNEWNISQLQTIAMEYPVFSKIHGFAGCLDWLAQDISGNIFIFDWKTSNAFRQKYYLQVAAYWKALQEMVGMNIKCAYIVVFDKKKIGYSTTLLEENVLEHHFRAFIDCLNMHKYLKSF